MAEAKVKIGIENSGFERGLAAMRQQASAWKDDMKSTIAGGFAFGAALSFFNNFRQEMGRIQDLADRFGQTTKSIQQVGNVAKVSGTDLEQVASILTKLTLEATQSGDAFAKVGINASEFAGAGYDQQILLLAGAWERANGDTAKQLELMTLLGAKGQDLLPMLSKGVATLSEEFAQVPVVSDVAIASMSRFNDFLDGLVTKAHEAAGAVVGLFQHAIAAGEAIGQMFTGDERTDRIKQLQEEQKSIADSNKKGGKSDAQILDDMERMLEIQKEIKDLQSGGGFMANYQKNLEKNGILDEASTAKSQGKGVSEADAKAAEDAKTKADAARVALEEKMKELARSRMSDEEKITDLEKEKAALAAKAQDATKTEEERLKAAKDMLDVQQQIEAIQQRIKKTKDDEAKTIADLEAKAAGMEDQQKLAAMDPAARAEELKKRQKALFDEAAAAEKDADRKRAAEKRIEALSLADDITRAQKEAEAKEKEKDKDKLPKDTQRPGVVSSSLAAIGGGGGVYVAQGLDPALQEARNQTNLLRQIATNTARGGMAAPTGTTNPF